MSNKMKQFVIVFEISRVSEFVINSVYDEIINLHREQLLWQGSEPNHQTDVIWLTLLLVGLKMYYKRNLNFEVV